MYIYIYRIVTLVSAQFVGYTADEGLQGQNILSITFLMLRQMLQ